MHREDETRTLEGMIHVEKYSDLDKMLSCCATLSCHI
jgi:hypothetical protein